MNRRGFLGAVVAAVVSPLALKASQTGEVTPLTRAKNWKLVGSLPAQPSLRVCQDGGRHHVADGQEWCECRAFSADEILNMTWAEWADKLPDDWVIRLARDRREREGLPRRRA